MSVIRTGHSKRVRCQALRLGPLIHWLISVEERVKAEGLKVLTLIECALVDTRMGTAPSARVGEGFPYGMRSARSG